MKNKLKLQKAFSLIELIFVIAVLGIIATFAVPKLLETRSSAVVTTIKQDISTITTAIQSQYMLNSTIDKITDSVTINEKNWEIEDKKIEYNIEGSNCVTIEVSTNTLTVKIDATSTDLCQKLYDSGIRDISYDLI
jgi:general secretion pathway protein G